MTRVITTTTMLNMASIFQLDTFGPLFGKQFRPWRKLLIFVMINLLEITVYPYFLKLPLT